MQCLSAFVIHCDRCWSSYQALGLRRCCADERSRTSSESRGGEGRANFKTAGERTPDRVPPISCAPRVHRKVKLSTNVCNFGHLESVRFLDTYRTLCIAPPAEIVALFEELRLNS